MCVHTCQHSSSNVDVSHADYTVSNETGKLLLMLSKSGLECDGHGRFENVISTLT